MEKVLHILLLLLLGEPVVGGDKLTGNKDKGLMSRLSLHSVVYIDSSERPSSGHCYGASRKHVRVCTPPAAPGSFPWEET